MFRTTNYAGGDYMPELTFTLSTSAHGTIATALTVDLVTQFLPDSGASCDWDTFFATIFALPGLKLNINLSATSRDRKRWATWQESMPSEAVGRLNALVAARRVQVSGAEGVPPEIAKWVQADGGTFP